MYNKYLQQLSLAAFLTLLHKLDSASAALLLLASSRAHDQAGACIV